MTEETLLEADELMQRAVDASSEDFATVRTGRANPALYPRCWWTTTALLRLCSNWRLSPSQMHAPSSSPL